MCALCALLMQMAYVRAMMEVEVLLQIQKHGGAYALALPGRDGRALHARVQDSKRVADLRRQLAKLQVKLGLKAPMPTADPDMYKSAQDMLKETELGKLQRGIEEQVSALQVLRLERAHGLSASARNTANLNKAAKRRRKNVVEMLAVMLTWDEGVFDVVPSQQQRRARTRDEMLAAVAEKVYRAEYPWADGGGAAAGKAALPTLASRYRDAAAGLVRCEEQLQLWRWEVQQAGLYYAHVQRVVSAAMRRSEKKANQLLGQSKLFWLDACAPDAISDAGAVKEARQSAADAFAEAEGLRHEVELLYRCACNYAGLSARLPALSHAL